MLVANPTELAVADDVNLRVVEGQLDRQRRHGADDAGPVGEPVNMSAWYALFRLPPAARKFPTAKP